MKAFAVLALLALAAAQHAATALPVQAAAGVPPRVLGRKLAASCWYYVGK